MCGVFGIFGHPEAANHTYLGLHALQHRGQESAGIVTCNGRNLLLHKGMGHVIDVFKPSQLANLTGTSAIGHVRYSTAGGSFLKNAQPIAVDYALGSLAIAHNGNLTNADVLRAELERTGSIFQTASDTEVIVHLIARSTKVTIEERIVEALSRVEGAYSLLCLTQDQLIAIRDPHGIRPLCLGEMPAAGQPAGIVAPRVAVLASEEISFHLINATFVRNIEPGEMLVIDANGMRSMHLGTRARRSCVFEYVYFARPDSSIDGISVYEARKNLGRAMARECPVSADVVIPVPDSGLPATIGYSQESGIPFEMGLVRSHYVGRTFIEPQQSIRHFGVRLKLNPVSEALRGKRVVVVDDSIVRGTTSRKIVKMIRDAGAREVHLRISSPPTQWPCFYGIDTPTRGELIASSHSVEEINQYITSDTLGYLSLRSMIGAVVDAHERDRPAPTGAGHLPILHEPLSAASFCHACWSGEYPIAFTTEPRRESRLLDA